MTIQELQAGDLLFVKDASDLSQAIQEATGKYSHVAIYFDHMIYHATRDKSVIKEDLAAFLASHSQAIAVYRYPQINVEKVFRAAENLLGKPYNDSFYPDNDAYYCSQYIASILPIFPPIPMQFGDGNQEISPFWQAYYDKLGLAVPFNQPGTNPSQLAQSKLLHYVGELI